ncbi:MAG: DUF2600 family protein [Selenomonadales bacterium]|nr:DUF2600 family protein [Selenomonadales bacterium]
MLRTASFFVRVVLTALPLSARMLRPYRARAAAVTGELGAQARASITGKTFHCQGASVYALCPSLVRRGSREQARYARFAVALQTISDYLDNLCDRADVYDERAFRTLHEAFCDALDPARALSDYYAHYPYKDDGGYLSALVADARSALDEGASVCTILPHLKMFGKHYTDLQTYKHIAPDLREERMRAWTNGYLASYPDIGGWEFAAACGSTLGIFALVSANDESMTSDKARSIAEAYFPYISGLHILLDYLIDREEDRAGGDLNFTFYYASQEETAKRLLYFTQRALETAERAPNSEFHTRIVYALLALYLTDEKTEHPDILPVVRLVRDALPDESKRYFRLCRLLRRLKRINR